MSQAKLKTKGDVRVGRRAPMLGGISDRRGCTAGAGIIGGATSLRTGD